MDSFYRSFNRNFQRRRNSSSKTWISLQQSDFQESIREYESSLRTFWLFYWTQSGLSQRDRKKCFREISYFGSFQQFPIEFRRRGIQRHARWENHKKIIWCLDKAVGQTRHLKVCSSLSGSGSAIWNKQQRRAWQRSVS